VRELSTSRGRGRHSANDARTVRLWNADTGQPIGGRSRATLTRCSVWRLAPTASRLAGASYDKTVRIWPTIATPEMLSDKLAANMSHKQWREWISADIEYVELCPGLPIPGDWI
jgi:WD40 repeat protein